MTETDPIEELFAISPEARHRLHRATVVAVRESGRTLDDVRPLSYSMRAGTLAIVDRDGVDLMRLPIESLTRSLD